MPVQRVHSDEEKFIALSFLKACGGNVKRAAKLAKVEPHVLKFWSDGGDENAPLDLSSPEFGESGGRPVPPDAFLVEDHPGILFAPAPDLSDWMMKTFIEQDAPLWNEDHWHLSDANIGVLWTNQSNARGGMTVAGTAELGKTLPGNNKWQKKRAELQMLNWFSGVIPDFLITLDAAHAASRDDASFCALCEHELYHCSIKLDEFDSPATDADGDLIYRIRPHDVEEFVGVWRRYGPGCGAGMSKALAAAASSRPTIAEAKISAACGTCGKSL